MGYQVPTYIIIKDINNLYYIKNLGDLGGRCGPYQTKWGARRALNKLIHSKDPIIIEQYDEKGQLINK